MFGRTAGRNVVFGGSVLLAFVFACLLYVRYGLPVLNRTLGFPAWYEKRWAKIWNYGLLAVLVVAGLIAVVVGLITWMTGTTFK